MQCSLFNNGLSIRPDGRVSPCCQWIHGKSWIQLDDDWGKYIDDKKEQFKKGWIPECNQCKNDEAITGTSERVEQNDFLREYAQSDSKKFYWDLKLHNTCNLTCRMCGPHDSSSWLKLINENKNEEWDADNILGINDTKFGWRENIPLLLKNHINDLKVLKFTGGEPFMIPQVKQLMKAVIKKGKADDVHIRITTNSTFELTNEWIEILRQFKRVSFSLSINGIKSRYEYIRQNADWETVYTNVMKMKDLKFIDYRVNDLYQILVYDMVDEINNFWKSKDVDVAWAHLTAPKYHSLNALPTHLLKKYNHWNGYKFNQALFDEFLKQTAIHDRIYGKDIRKQIPELFSK